MEKNMVMVSPGLNKNAEKLIPVSTIIGDHTFSMYAFGGGGVCVCKFEVHFAYGKGG
jgi:hypothetical protein